jgi:hypothetical protein
MTTWDSVCSTKRLRQLEEYEDLSFLLFFPPLIPLPHVGYLNEPLLYSILHDPFNEDLDHGYLKKENSKRFKRKTFNGDWVLGVPLNQFVPEVDWIGYRCDSETIVASRFLGELKKDVWHTFS